MVIVRVEDLGQMPRYLIHISRDIIEVTAGDGTVDSKVHNKEKGKEASGRFICLCVV